jgi:hypothetical protein
MHVLTKVAFLCGLIATCLSSSGTGKGSRHHWIAATGTVNGIYCTGRCRGRRRLRLRYVVPSLMIKSKPQPTKFEISALFGVSFWRNLTVWQYFITFYSVGLQTSKNGYKLQVSGNKIFVFRKDKVCGHKEWLGILGINTCVHKKTELFK